MKKILLTILSILSFSSFIYAENTLSNTKISSDNYGRLAKFFKAEYFSSKVNEYLIPEEELLTGKNDFQLVASIGHNAGAYRFLYAVLKEQRSIKNSSGDKFDVNAELLKISNNFYQLVEEYNSLVAERYSSNEKYAAYVFEDSLNEAEEIVFLAFKESVKGGFDVKESYEKVPAYSLNEIYTDYKANELAAREKWEGKQVKLTATVYSIYKMDMNSVFNISASEKKEVPVIRMNSGNQIYANFFFNGENLEKLSRVKKNKQLTIVGTVHQDIARRPGFVDCKIVE